MNKSNNNEKCNQGMEGKKHSAEEALQVKS